MDVNLNLETGLFRPYMKEGDKPIYVNSKSNHPPAILKNIPHGINRRLSSLSSNQEVFDLAAPPYQTELDRCGYDHLLEFSPPENQTHPRRRKRSKKRCWFNPPYSINVETNVGKIFLELLDKHFPPGHVLKSVMNRDLVKISYRCLPNMGSCIAKHNSKVLREATEEEVRAPPSCNCQISKKNDCPVPGACNQRGVVYQATVTSEGGVNTQTYVGLAKSFKNRYSKHKSSLKKYTKKNSTTLSTHFHKQRSGGYQPTISWKFLKTNIPTFNPVKNACRLCLTEKYIISFKPSQSTLNTRSEIFSSCRHKRSELLGPPNSNLTGG